MKLRIFLLRILKEFPFRFPSIIVFMAFVGILEGISISTLVPLLNIVYKGQVYIQSGGEDKISKIFAPFFKFLGFDITLANVLIFIFIIMLLQAILKLMQTLIEAKLHVDFHGRLIRRLYEAYVNASWPYFYKNKIGNLINNMVAETDRAASGLQFLAKMMSELSTAFFYIMLLSFISWKLTLGALVIGILGSSILMGVIRRAHVYGEALTKINNLMQSEVGEKLSAAKMIKATVTENQTVEKLETIVKEKLKYRFKSLMNSALIPAYFLPLMMGIICVGIYVSFTYISLDFSIIILFLVIFYRLMPRFQAIQNNYHQTVLFIPALAEIDHTLEKANAFKEKDDGKSLDSFRHSIQLKKVNFAYNNDKSLPTLSNIHLEIEKGKMTAIVGDSGSGKSTLADIILRLMVPQSGEIFVDGRLSNDIKKKAWRNKIGYVSQDIFLFNDTVKNNIAWVRFDASMEEIEEAAKFAYAHEFIIGFPAGYDTKIGDKGVCLSGGQRQRICLARAILQKPEILLLDEATSALDSESEMKIQLAVEHLAKQITVIIISHRLSTVRKSDIIYVMEHGKIIESGTWNELVTSQGRFQKLRELQLLE